MRSRWSWFRLLRPAMRLAWRFDDRSDPWECMEAALPPHFFGKGSQREFAWYLTGESKVPVRSFEQLCEFLLGCTYVHDTVLFQERDFWQHPLTFEQIRKGDCEDHALWAWRKLRDLGYPAHLVAGWCGLSGFDPEASHVWIVFEAEGELLLFETTAKKRASMVRPLASAKTFYTPYASVDHGMRLFAYAGVMHAAEAREEAKRLRRAGREPHSPGAAPGEG